MQNHLKPVVRIKNCDNKSVGMLIEKNDKYLLIERKRPPFGFAPPAGHVDDKGTFENAAREEVEEEVGLIAKEIKLLTEGKREKKKIPAGVREEIGITGKFIKLLQREK